MQDDSEDEAGSRNPAGRAPQSWLGTVAIVLGVLLAASHGTEWMKQVVFAEATPASGQLPSAECPEDELIEEGLSVAECEQLVSDVRSFIASAPGWFTGYQTAVSAAGTVLSLVSILVGAALVDHRAWGGTLAIPVFGALALIDLAGLVGAANTGPILRSAYMWNFVLWLAIHSMMTMGAAASRSPLVAPARAADG